MQSTFSWMTTEVDSGCQTVKRHLESVATLLSSMCHMSFHFHQQILAALLHAVDIIAKNRLVSEKKT